MNSTKVGIEPEAVEPSRLAPGGSQASSKGKELAHGCLDPEVVEKLSGAMLKAAHLSGDAPGTSQVGEGGHVKPAALPEKSLQPSPSISHEEGSRGTVEPGGSQAPFPSDQRGVFRRFFGAMQRRLNLAKADVEDLLTKLKHEEPGREIPGIKLPTMQLRPSEQAARISSYPGRQSGSAAQTHQVSGLDISDLETFRPPPMPLPYDYCPVKNAGKASGASKPKNIQHSRSSSGEALRLVQAGDGDSALVKELKKSNISRTSSSMSLGDEDCCPICLDGYLPENPRIKTNCGHHFHLACIYEWMERSPTCAVCSKDMVFQESL